MTCIRYRDGECKLTGKRAECKGKIGGGGCARYLPEVMKYDTHR